MGIAASIVSAVLKSVVGDKFGDRLAKDLIGISIDGVSEKGIYEITDFINGEKSKIDSILSKENMKSMGIPEETIDYAVAEIKDLFVKINITDEVLRQCQYNSTILKDFMWNEYVVRKNRSSYIESESEIKACLFEVADALNKVMHESEEFSDKMLIQISNAVDDTNVGLQHISDYMKENFGKLDDNSQTVLNLLLSILEQIQKMNMQSNGTKSITDEKKKFKNNRKGDYIKNWNSRLFLHQDNDERPITLADAFIMPNYQLQQGIERIGFRNSGILDKAIDQFINYDKTSVLLIVGDPGIGKSTITSWIANNYKFDDNIIILRFRDWESEELEKGLLKAIYTILECNKIDLNNKILILDGFDEIKSLHIGELLLSSLLNDILDFENFKIIITSRPDYVKFEYFQNVLRLLPFNKKQIKKFYQIITNRELNETRLYDKNKDVFGIPVILYMAIMSNIDITQSATKPELYCRIFKKRGGIFDKFSHEGVSYDNGSQVLRSIENIEIYLDFLQKTAFKMFEKNIPYLMKEEYKIPNLFFQGRYVNVLEFPIRHLFENTKSNIEFIHKSIFEYFVSEFIFISIDTLRKTEKEEIDFATCLANILKYNPLSKEILEFLKYKIRKSGLNDKFNIVKDAFLIMLRDGMIYHTKEIYENIIKYEMNVFTNMLEIIHLWEFDNLSIECDVVDKYLRYKHDVSLNLSNFNFEGVNLMYLCLSKANLRNSRLINIKAVDAELEEADLTDAKLHHIDLRFANLRAATLTEIDLRDADLRKANFQDADLIGADLRGAMLCKADLRGALLVGIRLEGADLTDAIISESQIGYLEIKYNMHGIKVYIEKTREVISYERYQKRRDRKDPRF